MRFKTAARSSEELTSAKVELNNIFLEAVRGNNGKYNPRGVEVLHTNRMDIAELIVQIIKDEVTTTDPTPFLVDQVDGDIRDNYVFQRMDGTLRVVSRAYGSKPLSERLTFSEYSIKTSMKEIAVELPLEEIAGGRITPAQVAEEMAFAINRNRITTIMDAIDAGVPSAADRSGVSGYNLRYGSLTDANLQKAVDGLMDESETPTIFGRHTALYPAIRNFTGWSADTKKEFEQRGQIGTYYGANIVVLRDTYSRTAGAHALRSDRVYVASATKGAIMMTKDVSFLNWAEVSAKNSSFGTGIRLEDGLLVHDPYKYRIITV